MHILLTDVLACPRCGPELGLIVLADRLEDRRVMEGRLGCANCREEYPIADGVADLRVPTGSRGTEPLADAPLPAESRDSEDEAFRTAALLGVGEATGTVLLLEASPERVHRVGELLPNAQVVGGSRAGQGAAAGAGWVLYQSALPFRDRSLRGVALSAGAAPDLIAEAARVLAPGARLILERALPEMRQALAEEEVSVLLDQDGVVVASAPGAG